VKWVGLQRGLRLFLKKTPTTIKYSLSTNITSLMSVSHSGCCSASDSLTYLALSAYTLHLASGTPVYYFERNEEQQPVALSMLSFLKKTHPTVMRPKQGRCTFFIQIKSHTQICSHPYISLFIRACAHTLSYTHNLPHPPWQLLRLSSLGFF
jgi:hypothetical protein